jgi:hypothetical protein
VKELDRVEAQLARVLEFFPRVDAKASGLFGVNSAMLTITALNVKPTDLRVCYIAIPLALMLVALLISYCFLHWSNFPQTRGGEGSLIYFVEIRKRSKDEYIEQYERIDTEGYRRDLLEQVWRNSEILCDKYRYVAAALRATLASIVPFLVILSATSLLHSAIPAVKG